MLLSIFVTIPPECERMSWLLDFLEKAPATTKVRLFFSSKAVRTAINSSDIQQRLQHWAQNNNYVVPVCSGALLREVGESYQLADNFVVSGMGQWIEDTQHAQHVIHWGAE